MTRRRAAGLVAGVLAIDGWVKADQPTTVPHAILRGPIGRLAPAAIDRLDEALRFVLDL